MSKLSDFYHHKDAITGVDDCSRLERIEWDRLEDELINEEIVPELLDAIMPSLQKVKSALDIHVIYDPAGILSVTASRCSVHGIIGVTHSSPSVGIEEEGEEPQPETDTYESEDSLDEKFTRSKSIGFSVVFPDGTIFHERKAVQTFVQALSKIGLSRISSGKHGVIHNGVNVVSRAELEDNGQDKIQIPVEGFFVYTKLSNKSKVEDLQMLSKYYNLGLEISWDTEPKSAINPLKKKGTRDTTKYSLNGGPGLAKRRLALAIVKQYVADNPSATLNDLEKVFPGSLISGRYGVVRSIDDLPNISEEEKHKRYFMDDDDVIFLDNDDIVVVCSQWRDNIQGIIDIAKGLGYSITSI